MSLLKISPGFLRRGDSHDDELELNTTMLNGGEYERISHDVYLPNGQELEGKEAIGDSFG